MKKTTFFILSILFITTFFFACKHEIPLFSEPTPIPGSTGITCSVDSVYFANTILPLINSGCATVGCHNAASQANGIILNNYANIMKYVSIGNASSSKLYKVLIETGSKRMPLAPLPAFTSTQIAQVQKWINQGAKNNGCDKCDTIDFKYSTAIKPLIQSKCQGCHNPASLGGNIDLSTYTATKVSVLNGKLYGSINWAAGFSAMPKSSVKMPACEITQIKKWIDAGSQNN
jgi:uncharacterized membrane protein